MGRRSSVNRESDRAAWSRKREAWDLTGARTVWQLITISVSRSNEPAVPGPESAPECLPLPVAGGRIATGGARSCHSTGLGQGRGFG
jgi:hypothetical protein